MQLITFQLGLRSMKCNFTWIQASEMQFLNTILTFSENHTIFCCFRNKIYFKSYDIPDTTSTVMLIDHNIFDMNKNDLSGLNYQLSRISRKTPKKVSVNPIHSLAATED